MRMGVIGQLERQIMLATGCPGLLIYGRRRMGKSTLLRNLGGYLPAVGVGSCQSRCRIRAAFTSIPSLAQLIAQKLNGPILLGDLRGVRRGVATRSAGPTNLPNCFKLLDDANAVLENDDRRVILALTSSSSSTSRSARAVFNNDLLATIRESIQMHRRLIWIFVGSHHITELRHAPWDSYSRQRSGQSKSRCSARPKPGCFSPSH